MFKLDLDLQHNQRGREKIEIGKVKKKVIKFPFNSLLLTESWRKRMHKGADRVDMGT